MTFLNIIVRIIVFLLFSKQLKLEELKHEELKKLYYKLEELNNTKKKKDIPANTSNIYKTQLLFIRGGRVIKLNYFK